MYAKQSKAKYFLKMWIWKAVEGKMYAKQSKAEYFQKM